MKKWLGRTVNIVMMVTMAIMTLVGCNGNGITSKNGLGEANTISEKTEIDVSQYKEFLTIDVFCSQANYQGLQSGWFAQVVRDRFNMELNIIAPNVAGGGDTLFQTRSAAGNLGDLIMIGSENGRLADTIQAGLLYDITDLVKNTKYLSRHPEAIKMIQGTANAGDRVYAFPSAVSNFPATTPSEGLEFTYGPYIRWDYYLAMGAPKISTLEDLLPMLKEMQERFPTSDSGKKAYAFSLFKDWDNNMMTLAKQPACFYGYDEVGFLLNRADGRDYQSIIDTDSEYVRALKFYHDANQMGILDPESTTQNWDTVSNKYIDGAVLFSPWPWLGQAAYNTFVHKEAGKGFMLVPIDDIEIFSYGATPTGSKYVVGVGSNAQDPERMVDFINWLYSPEGIMMSSSQTGGTCGPEGLTWTVVDGRPELTDFGKEALLNGDAPMPEAWGGGSWKDGTSQLNFTTVLPVDVNPESGIPYSYNLWDSVIELNSTLLDRSWQEVTGALSTRAYLEENNQYVVAPGTDYIPESEPSEISTLRAQCKVIIVENSWKMVFAKDEDEFYKLLTKMQETVYDLGYQQVLDFDIKTVEALNAARTEAAEISE